MGSLTFFTHSDTRMEGPSKDGEEFEVLEGLED